MVSRKELLKNLNKYSAEEIAEAVRLGEVSLYELSKETRGAFTPLLKRRVKELVENPLVVESQEPKGGMNDKSMLDLMHEVCNEEARCSDSEVDTLSDADMSQEESESNTITSVHTESAIDNKGMFLRPFSFNGRIRRLEYGVSFIILFVCNFFFNLMISLTTYTDYFYVVLWFWIISQLPLLWFNWAQNCKRCHDRGNSGWWQLIPFYGFVLLFGDGDKGENKYGNSPKE